MSESLNQPTQEIPLPDHRGRTDVYGHDTIVDYEKNLAMQIAPEEQAAFQENMRDAREVMAAYSQDEELNKMTDSYFETYATMPQIFRQGKQQAEYEAQNQMSWTAWLAEKADDQQVLNFLQWHNNEHETRESSTEFANGIETQKSEFASRVEYLKQQGVLHEEALPDTQELKNIKVSTQDVFSVLTVPGSGHHSDPDNKDISMIEGFKPVELWHELSHSVLGKLAEDGDDPKQWLNEAVTEHIARVMKDGNAEVVDPARRSSHEPGAYVLERQILNAVLMSGAITISPNYLTQLYSARTEAAKVKATAELHNKLMEAYGDADVLNKVTARLAEVTQYTGGLAANGEQAMALAEQLITDPARTLGLQNKMEVVAANSSRRINMTDSERAAAKIEKWRKLHMTDEGIIRAYEQTAANGSVTARREIGYAREQLKQSDSAVNPRKAA